MFSVHLIPGKKRKKPRQMFGKIREQIKENQRRSRDRSFQQAMEAQTTCFISFIKLLFSLLTKRKTIYKARMYFFNFCYETLNCYNMEAAVCKVVASGTAEHIILG